MITKKQFRLSALIISDNQSVVKSVIEGFADSNGTIKPIDGGFESLIVFVVLCMIQVIEGLLKL